MGDFFLRLVVAGGIMGVLDALWLGIVANKLYKSLIGHLLAEKPNMFAAVAFYVIYVVGIIVFVLTPSLDAGSWQHALGYGALFGFVAYATYDLTNLATIKNWPVKLVVIDMVWGTVITTVVATLSYLILSI